jgi:uncharacterized protein (UPF0333 family)
MKPSILNQAELLIEEKEVKMNNYNKKGQAALEFLMTYGWAILAAIIVIGALGTYFYFNQGGKDTLYINAPFYGIASSISTTQIQVELENKGGEDLRTVTLNVSNGGCTQVAVGDISGSDAAQIVTVTCSGLGTGTFKGDITITYLRPGSSLPLTTTGSISGPVK